MKKSQLSEEQILFALPQAQAGLAVADICRKLGISATYLLFRIRN
jgi:putative transposase